MEILKYISHFLGIAGFVLSMINSPYIVKWFYGPHIVYRVQRLLYDADDRICSDAIFLINSGRIKASNLVLSIIKSKTSLFKLVSPHVAKEVSRDSSGDLEVLTYRIEYLAPNQQIMFVTGDRTENIKKVKNKNLPLVDLISEEQEGLKDVLRRFENEPTCFQKYSVE